LNGASVDVIGPVVARRQSRSGRIACRSSRTWPAGPAAIPDRTT